MVLPTLAADKGRSRAATLLAILGVGPDEVQRHLNEIDVALGADSVGTVALADLVNETRAASSAAAPTIPRQHIISQGILRRFTELIDPRAGKQLASYDIVKGKTKLIGTRGVGFVMNFVKIDSAATEQVWQRVEDSLPEAITAAERGTVMSDPRLIGVIRDAIALHYVRNPQVRDVHNKVFPDVHARALDSYANTLWSEEAFRRAYGLEPAGPQARRLGAEILLSRISLRWNEGVIFRLRVQDLFETISDHFANHGLEILSPASANKEFLIGDVPALTLNYATGTAGVAEGVALFDANTIVLPLAPRVLAAIGPANAIGTCAGAQVDALNALQVRVARECVYYRPQAGLAAFIATARPPTSSAP
jgi:hypothetical protein